MWFSFILFHFIEFSRRSRFFPVTIHTTGEQIELCVIWLISSSTSCLIWQGLCADRRQMQRFFTSTRRMLMKQQQYQQLHHQQSTFFINICSRYKSPLSSYVSFTFNKLCFTKWRMMNVSTTFVALNELQKVLQLITLFFNKLLALNEDRLSFYKNFFYFFHHENKAFIIRSISQL